jgi:hypothetical protein
MIRASVDLLPFGMLEGLNRLLNIQIVNINTSKNNIATYECTINGTIFKVFKHDRNDGIVSLMIKVLKKYKKITT